MERLLAHINPHHPPPDRALLDAQRACGRWCALRRLRHRLTSEQLAGMAGVSTEQLGLLEAGLAEAGDLPETARPLLSTFLRSGHEDSAWVAQVIVLASGRAEALSVAVVGPVLDELAMLDDPSKRELELALELIEPSQVEQPTVTVDLSAFKHAPAMFEVLQALVDGESYPYAIWEKVHSQLRSVGIAELGELIDQMCASNLIKQTEMRLDPALDDEPLPFYRISSSGRQAWNAERTRRAVQQAESQLEPQVDPGVDPATPFTKL